MGDLNQSEYPNGTNAQTIEINADRAQFKSSASVIITENIRSGQQVYAKGGDLVVMASSF